MIIIIILLLEMLQIESSLIYQQFSFSSSTFLCQPTAYAWRINKRLVGSCSSCSRQSDDNVRMQRLLRLPTVPFHRSTCTATTTTTTRMQKNSINTCRGGRGGLQEEEEEEDCFHNSLSAAVVSLSNNNNNTPPEQVNVEEEQQKQQHAATATTHYWPSSRHDGIFLAYQQLLQWNDDNTDDNDDATKSNMKKKKKHKKKITIIYLPGYNSNMTGTKSNHIWQWCDNNKCNMLRFDYTGHGASDGSLQDYGITTWLNDCQWMIESLVLSKRRHTDSDDMEKSHDNNDDYYIDHSIVLVGASMGAWLAMLLLLTNCTRTRTPSPLPIHGILTLAAAPDFTEFIYNNRMNEKQRLQMTEIGFVDLPSRYQNNEPYRYSHTLIREGREHLLLSSSSSSSSLSDNRLSWSNLPNDIPIILIHGTNDQDISYSFSEQLFHACCNGGNKMSRSSSNNNVHLHLVAGGDHRLSDNHHLDMISMHLDYIVRQISST